MKITKVTYAMLRVTNQYENDRAEVTVELDAEDDTGEAVRAVKRACERALATQEYEGF